MGVQPRRTLKLVNTKPNLNSNYNVCARLEKKVGIEGVPEKDFKE